MEFKIAKRTEAERKDHKRELDEMFTAAMVSDRGTFNPRGMEVLNKNKMAIAETVVQLIEDEVAVSDPLPYLVDRKSRAWGDDTIFQRFDGTLKVTDRAYGTKPLSSRITASEYSFKTSHREIAVEIPLEELVGGRITPSKVVEVIAFAINRYRLQMVVDGIDAAVPASADRTGIAGNVSYNGTNVSMGLRYTGLSEANLSAAIDSLRDEAQSPTIFGRHMALNPDIRYFSGWSTEQKGEFLARGGVGEFLGCPVVTMVDQYNRLTGGHALSDKKIYVAGATKGAWLVEEDVSWLNWSLVDERTATFATGIRLQEGLFVHNPYAYRIITKP